MLKLKSDAKIRVRSPARKPQPLVAPPMSNQTLSMDFMSDVFLYGRPLRIFNVVDDFNRESLAIKIDLNLPSPWVKRLLDQIASQRGYPTRASSYG